MIYFTRHGLSETNTKRVFAGQQDDSPLTKEGVDQAEETSNRIVEENLVINRIVSSPSKRSMETAEIIAKKLNFDSSKIIKDDRILEYNMGDLYGTPWYSIQSEILVKTPNAEDSQAFRDRIYSCVKEYSELEGNTLLVSHGGVGKMLQTIKNKKEPKFFYDTPIYPDASIVEIYWIK